VTIAGECTVPMMTSKLPQRWAEDSSQQTEDCSEDIDPQFLWKQVILPSSLLREARIMLRDDE
jgi:hypothetical protein